MHHLIRDRTMFAFCVCISTLSKSHAESTWMPFAFECTILRVTAQSFVPPIFFSSHICEIHPSPSLSLFITEAFCVTSHPVPTFLPNGMFVHQCCCSKHSGIFSLSGFFVTFVTTSKAITLCVVIYFLMLVPMQNSILICDRIIYAFCVCILTLSKSLAKPT